MFHKIFFIDFGNTEIIPINKLYGYGPRLLKLVGKIPAQAFKCVLSKLKPSPFKYPDGKWSANSKDDLEKLIEYGELVGSVYSVVDGVVSLVLYKLMQKGSETIQINLNEYLIENGFAELKEENYFSKVCIKFKLSFYDHIMIDIRSYQMYIYEIKYI